MEPEVMNFTGKTGRARKVPRILTTAMLTGLILNGCLLDRIKVAKIQLCEYESNFSLQVGERAEFIFRNPVFLPSDVKTMSGHGPSEVYQHDGRLHWRYIVEKWSTQPSARERYPVDLHFVDQKGEYKLNRVEFPAMIGAFIGPDTMTSSAADICDFDWKQISRTIEQRITDEQMAQLPRRDLLLSTLGTPTDLVDDGKGLYYEFRIIGSDEDPVIGEFTVWYEVDEAIPTRMVSRSKHVMMRADFDTRRLSMSYGF